jgi:hypothetical protein
MIQFDFNSPGERFSSSAPVSTFFTAGLVACGSMIPRWRAISAAVRGWSPVIMMVRIPADLVIATASRTSFLGGSINPNKPIKVRFRSRPAWTFSGIRSMSRTPTASTLIPCRASRLLASSIRLAKLSSNTSPRPFTQT